MRKLTLKCIGIIILTLLALAIALPNQDGKVFGISVPKWWPNIQLSLGLDLQGGTQLSYVIDLSDIPADRIDNVVSGVEEVIRRRVDGLGVSEPVIQTSEVGVQRHLIVELPGIKDLEVAKATVGKVVELSFREQQTEVTDEEKERVKESNIKIKESANTLFSSAKGGKELKDVATENVNTEYNSSVDFEELLSLEPEVQNTLKGLSVEGKGVLVETDDAYKIVKLLEQKTDSVKEVDASHILVAYQGALRANTEVTRSKEEAQTKAKELIERLNKGEDFVALAKAESDEETETGELPSPVKKAGSYVPAFTDGALLLEKAGDVTKTPVESEFGFHIIMARDIRTTDVDMVKYEQVSLRKEQENASGWKATELTGEHFSLASAGFDQNSGQVLVNIEFNDKGKDIFAEITKRNLNKPLAIFLDDKPIIGDTVYAPIIRSEITDGKAQISGSMDYKEAIELAQNMNAGAIPAPISLIGQRTVGATLGEQALQSGLKAGLIGIIILFIYMIAYYRLVGLFADIALIIYALVLVSIFKLWPVTLSLAGIAGVIFSIGVAVDANVLIFERMKEELKLGKSTLQAIEEGFTRAWSSIRDSNISSLLICLILFIFGSGMIRGFAVTLSIGILLSMFSAIIVTRTFLLLYASKAKVKNSTLVGLSDSKK